MCIIVRLKSRGQSSFPHIFLRKSDVSLPISLPTRLCVECASLVVLPPFLLFGAPMRNHPLLRSNLEGELKL